MEIQQHGGVVVDVAGLGRASPSFCERERCSRGGGRRPRLFCYCPPSPPLYIGPLGGGGAPARSHLGWGAAAKRGEGVALPPKASGKPPHPRVPNPRRMGGGPWGGAQPTRGWFPSHFSPWGPPG